MLSPMSASSAHHTTKTAHTWQEEQEDRGQEEWGQGGTSCPKALISNLEPLRVFLKGNITSASPQPDFEILKPAASSKCCYILLLTHEIPCYPHVSVTFLSCMQELISGS